MAITNYTELQAAVTNWLNRADLSLRIPEFIALAEANLRRELRDKKGVTAAAMTAGVSTYTLPATVKELKSLRYDTSSMKWALREVSEIALASVRRAGSGIPTHYSVLDGVVYFNVAPSDAFAISISYVEKITALSGGSPTNTTLTNSPDLYLYGALVQAAPFLDHDERVQMWYELLGTGIAKENSARERAEFGASPEADLPVVFGGEE